MQFNDLGQFLHFAVALKVGLLAVLFLFVVFLFVVWKQVRSMNQIITQTFFGGVLNIVAIILLFFGISLFVIALVIL
jgi:hypothetical protein